MYHILIIEDDVEINRLLTEFLEENGYYVVSQYNGAGQEGENTEKGTLFLCLLRKFFIFFVLISLYGEKAILPNLCKRKNAAISKRLQRFLKSIFNFAGRFYLSSFSTSEISFAVAVTIRMPLSLISSRRASSCRRFVSFPAGVSKRNWSTDIL